MYSDNSNLNMVNIYLTGNFTKLIFFTSKLEKTFWEFNNL